MAELREQWAAYVGRAMAAHAERHLLFYERRPYWQTLRRLLFV